MSIELNHVPIMAIFNNVLSLTAHGQTAQDTENHANQKSTSLWIEILFV